MIRFVSASPCVSLSLDQTAFFTVSRWGTIPTESDGRSYTIFSEVGQTILPGTTEVVDTGVSLRVPDGLTAMICGRHREESRGQIFPFIVCGARKGPLRVPVSNLTNAPIRLERGVAFASIVFFAGTLPLLEQAPCIPRRRALA